jgi:DNA-binding protein H-NS
MKKITPEPIKIETNKNPPKYKNPNSEETWSGYGRKPNWVKDLLLSGKELVQQTSK